jgi:hypothetical protein
VRALTKADKERGIKLRDLGCIVCLNEHEVFTEPAIHHLNGKVRERCHEQTIPLCPRHHQIKDNNKPPRWFTRHGEYVHFEEAYGTEWELLEQVNGLIA